MNFLLSVPNFLVSLGENTLLQMLAIVIPLFSMVFIILERFIPYSPSVPIFRRGLWMDLVWYTLIQSKLLQILIFNGLLIPLKFQLGLGAVEPFEHWNFWILLVFFLVTHDFYMYWFHRWQHYQRILWRTHEAHHSGREVDWLAGSRSHFIEILINQTIEFAPIFLLLDAKLSAYMYPIKAMIDAIWGMWIHTNINVHTGKLQYILNGPEMHQWHHGNHKEVFFKNFSTKFAFWDWLFYTAYLPGLNPIQAAVKKPILYGLPYPFPKDYFSQMIFSIHRFNLTNWNRNRIYIWIKSLRLRISVSLFDFLGIPKKKARNILFPSSAFRYRFDVNPPHCSICQGSMKYYYLRNVLMKVCPQCDSSESIP